MADLHCFAKGQTRRLGARCTDPTNHMPFGVMGEVVVHLANKYVALFNVPNEANIALLTRGPPLAQTRSSSIFMLRCLVLLR